MADILKKVPVREQDPKERAANFKEVCYGYNLEENYYKINLIGKSCFEIDIYDIKKYIQNENVLKIKDSTTRKFDLESIEKENSLRGIFVKKMLERLKEHPEQEDKIVKAIEIGLDAMM